LEQQVAFFLALAVGLVFGGLAVWLMLRADTNNAYGRAKSELASELNKLTERLSGKEARINELMTDRDQLKAELDRQRQDTAAMQAAKAELEARVKEKDKAAEERLAAVNQAEEKLTDTFRALSAEALQTNNQTFLHLAQATLERFQEGAKNDLESRQEAISGLVKPLHESLGKVDDSIREIEKSRTAAYAGISEQVQSLLEVQNLLRSETSNLVGALRTPTVRGRWGEIQLRRVVEMAGMVPYCDFEEQPSIDTDDGKLRPDMIVRLPGQRQVVVDVKVALKAYLEAVDAADEETRQAKLSEHASQIRTHLQQLGGKAYWDRLPGAPEFVVAFLPGEAFFSAALEKDPGLIEFGIEHKVILATPTTLIALLKAVSYGWRQEKLAQNAEQISELGKTLYDRLCTFTHHVETVGTNLKRTVEGYNRAVGSLESRVLVGARRFQDLGVAPADKEMPPLEPVDNFPRSLQAVERAVAAGVLETPVLEAPAEEEEALEAGEPESGPSSDGAYDAEPVEDEAPPEEELDEIPEDIEIEVVDEPATHWSLESLRSEYTERTGEGAEISAEETPDQETGELEETVEDEAGEPAGEPAEELDAEEEVSPAAEEEPAAEAQDEEPVPEEPEPAAAKSEAVDEEVGQGQPNNYLSFVKAM